MLKVKIKEKLSFLQKKEYIIKIIIYLEFMLLEGQPSIMDPFRTGLMAYFLNWL
jgi:hypothetical protein